MIAMRAVTRTAPRHKKAVRTLAAIDSSRYLTVVPNAAPSKLRVTRHDRPQRRHPEAEPKNLSRRPVNVPRPTQSSETIKFQTQSRRFAPAFFQGNQVFRRAACPSAARSVE
jgi:hypothetical protein